MPRPKLFALSLFLLLLAACGASTPEPASITIEMDEYSYLPESIQLKVGQQVTLTLLNIGQLDHELMIGRLVTRNDQGQPNGFSTDFFIQAEVIPEVSGGGMLMEHSDEDGMEGMDHAEDSEEMAAMENAMVSQPAGADPTTVTFTVTEEMLGTWEIGCFEEEGVHYTSGMTGQLTVSR
jgi:plastocyanin